MEFALKTAFINTFPTQTASPATRVPPSTCPSAECVLGHGQGGPPAWARCPQETSRSGPWARGAGMRLLQHHPRLSPHLDTHWADALGTSGRPTLCTKPETRVSASPATPHVPGANPSAYSAPPCPSRLPGTQRRAGTADGGSLYLRSLRAAGAGGHRRSGWSGHSASRRAPREWGPPARQTARDRVSWGSGLPSRGPLVPITDTPSDWRFPQGPSAMDRWTTRLGVGRWQSPGLTARSTRSWGQNLPQPLRPGADHRSPPHTGPPAGSEFGCVCPSPPLHCRFWEGPPSLCFPSTPGS